MERIVRFVLLASVVSMLAAPLLADEGRIPLWEATVITEPGKYVVTRNITSGTDPVIEVQASAVDVDIDLNGFTVKNDAGGDAIVGFPGLRSLAVRNGTVEGGNFNTIGAASVEKVTVEDVNVNNTGQCGILVDSARSVAIRRNLISGGDCGISIQAVAGSNTYQGTLEHNEISRSGLGILLSTGGSSVAVRHNRIEITTGNLGIGNGIVAFQCDALLIAENTIEQTNQAGILLEEVSSSKIYNNVVTRSEEDGILLTQGSNDNLLLDNNSSNNAGSGLVVEGARNQIRGSVLNGNNGFGLYFRGAVALGNTYGGNTARGNAGGVGAGCTPVPCGLVPNHCDEPGATNDSFGENLNPGPPAC